MSIDPNPFVRLRRKPDFLKWLMIAAMFVLSYLLFYQLTLRPSSDISIHTVWAGEGDFRDPRTFFHHGAHPLWHILVCLVCLLGVPLETSAALVTAFCKAAEIWLIHRLFAIYLSERLSSNALTLLAFVVSTVSALCLPFYNPTVYYGVGTPNTWHSCTQLIAMVFMLICVPYTAHCYDLFIRTNQGNRTLLPWRKPLLLGALLLISLLAKPTFMQAFLPAACLYFLVQWIRHPKNSRFFLQIVLCVLPSVLFMIVQYMYYFGLIVPQQGSMILQFTWEKGFDLLIRLMLMLAFPLYAAITTRRDEGHDTLFWLTLVYAAVSAIEFLILGESGRRAADGNFAWGMMGAMMMVWVVCTIRFFRNGAGVRRTDGRLSACRVVGYALLLWHFISGVYYIVYLFMTSNVL